MALPEGFSEFEFLQDTMRRVQNQIVREEFNDLGGEDWDPDITTGRGALRQACTLKDSDSADMLVMRLWLFYVMLRKAQDMHPAIYGIPAINFHETVAFHPQIQLFFREDASDVEHDFSPLTSEISFRLINESPQTMTEAKAFTLAQKIRTHFATNKGFRWKRGRVKITYLDKSKGYDFRLFAWDKAEGKRVIEEVLGIQNHTPDWDNLSEVHREKSYSIIPGNQLVFGKQRRKPRERPIGYVRFRWAELKLHGLVKDIVLVDMTGYWRNAMIRAF